MKAGVAAGPGALKLMMEELATPKAGAAPGEPNVGAAGAPKAGAPAAGAPKPPEPDPNTAPAADPNGFAAALTAVDPPNIDGTIAGLENGEGWLFKCWFGSPNGDGVAAPKLGAGVVAG